MLAAGCDHGSRRVEPPPPPAPTQTPVQIDREHQRLVADYQPVSVALTNYELSVRDWRLGRLGLKELELRAGAYRKVVVHALQRVRGDRATGRTARGKQLLAAALRLRASALATPPNLRAYRVRWNRSLANARAGLTVLQDLRDRARLIPLPEDSVS